MTPLEIALAIAVLVLAAAVFVLVLRVTAPDEDPIDERTLQDSVGGAIADLELDSTAGQIETHAREMKSMHADVERMLRTPAHRGAFGERQLEAILEDQLPPEMYGTQESVVGNLRPDAHIETPEGVICIDSKFPLEQYEAALAADDEDDAERHRLQFARAVEDTLEKIETDYVRPDAGTTEFAFAFVPSERVYYYLVREEYDMLREYTREGVQVVSPLTFGHKLELIKAGVHARRLSERAEAVRAELHRLGGRFDDFADEWDTFRRHIRNAKNKADDADAAFEDLRAEFDRIDRLSLGEADGVEGTGVADDATAED